MVKCMECGRERVRINARHLRSKTQCTAKLNSLNDYLEKYPGADFMEMELRKRTAVTLENLIVKHGTDEGQQRWDLYRARQSKSNTFEYKQSKHGWNEEDFFRYNLSRAVTIDNLIKKHGEYEGMLRWKAYCDRQAFTCSKQYFTQTYGEKDGLERFNHWSSARSIQGKLNLDYSIHHTVSDVESAFFQELSCLAQLDEKYRNRWFYIPNVTSKEQSRRNIDYLDYSRHIAIEFYGDYYHMNSEIYKCDDWNARTRQTAKTRWEYDRCTITGLELADFRVQIVWERNWRLRPQHVLEEVVSWLGTS